MMQQCDSMGQELTSLRKRPLLPEKNPFKEKKNLYKHFNKPFKILPSQMQNPNNIEASSAFFCCKGGDVLQYSQMRGSSTGPWTQLSSICKLTYLLWVHCSHTALHQLALLIQLSFYVYLLRCSA